MTPLGPLLAQRGGGATGVGAGGSSGAGGAGAGAGAAGVAASSVRAGPPGAAATEQDTAGPSSGWPRRIWHGPVMPIRSTRSWPRYVPLVLPASSSSHWPPAARKTACSQDTICSSTTRSDRGSRPTRYVNPGSSVWSDPWIRTTRAGATTGAASRSAVTHPLYVAFAGKWEPPQVGNPNGDGTETDGSRHHDLRAPAHRGHRGVLGDRP